MMRPSGKRGPIRGRASWPGTSSHSAIKEAQVQHPNGDGTQSRPVAVSSDATAMLWNLVTARKGKNMQQIREERLKEILDGLIGGLNYGEIAQRKGAPLKQVRRDMRRIVRMLGARTTEQAIAIYLKSPVALRAVAAGQPSPRMKNVGLEKFRALLASSEREAIVSALYSFIEPGENCWLWKGKRQKGYPVFEWRNLRFRGAHRLIYELERGEVGDLFVCHLCDNPPCVRPNHLWLGTHADNMADMVAKGRARNGRVKVAS